MPRHAPQPNVYAADMTKILSAESFVKERVQQFTKKPILIDPNAKRDLCQLVDLLCNDSWLYFKSPQIPPSNPGPIQKAWSAIAKQTGEHSPPPGPPKRTVSDEGLAASSSFAKFVTSQNVANKLVSWVAFQVSDSRLQEIFWENNKEENLEEALRCTYKSFRWQASAAAHSRDRKF